MDRRWNRNVISLLSPVTAEMRLLISCVNSMAVFIIIVITALDGLGNRIRYQCPNREHWSAISLKNGFRLTRTCVAGIRRCGCCRGWCAWRCDVNNRKYVVQLPVHSTIIRRAVSNNCGFRPPTYMSADLYYTTDSFCLLSSSATRRARWTELNHIWPHGRK